MYDKEKVIGWALGEVGYHEGPNNWNRYAEHLDSIPGFYNGPKQNQPWCDIFVDDCFVICYGVDAAKKLLCQPDYSCGAGCLYSMQYFQQAGQFHKTGAQTGDQIFFSYKAGEISHTGIVVEVTSDHVITVEGNTSDGVYKRTYPILDSRIYGYGRPDWNIGGDDPTPVPEPTPTPGGINLPTLRQGDGMNNPSEVVRAAQFLLNGRGASCGRYGADGEFGPATKSAVLAYQRRTGLEADGIIGDQTWRKLLGVM